ncbi:hypothetical protein CFC21_013274 [Triticum aestivum]|uniref:Uncharacterized protein n=2 Tax=Triticum aestivum TaxID=4565 RepID=A0A3B6A0V3_WHEAT|nr:hypothetical protein CFC21_013274 [Triticum aestivum]
MGSPTRTRPSSSSDKRGGAPTMRLVWAFLAVLLLVLLRCSPCQGRKLPVADQEQGGKVMHFEGGLVLRVSPSHDGEAASAAAAPRGFSRAARSMRSVPSPGVGH